MQKTYRCAIQVSNNNRAGAKCEDYAVRTSRALQNRRQASDGIVFAAGTAHRGRLDHPNGRTKVEDLGNVGASIGLARRSGLHSAACAQEAYLLGNKRSINRQLITARQI